MKISGCTVVVALILASSIQASAISVKGESQGNVYSAGTPMKFVVEKSSGAISYEAIDYFGRTVAKGTTVGTNGSAEIEIAGLQPGWYDLKCSDRDGKAETSIGVVIDRKDAPLQYRGRVCADAASAWLINNDEYRKPFARMVRMAGIPWVRERMSWVGMEPKRGEFDWRRYDDAIAPLFEEGIRIDEIIHDSPEWSHPGRKGSVCPDDLCDLYRFMKAASKHYAGKVQSWEIWNEPEVEFWPDLSDRFSGYAKAAYLGMKDGNRKAVITDCALCVGVSPFSRAIFQSGIGDYSEIFAWHVYLKPSEYAGVLNKYIDMLHEYGADNRPAWLTESGIVIKGSEGEDKRLLGASDQVTQCRFIPRSLASSLAAGDARHFFFVLPDYKEGPNQFGALHPDLTPYPSFVALSASANILGLSNPLGEVKTGNDKVTAYLFSTPKGNVLVAWADEETEISIPTERGNLRVADIFGKEETQPSEGGFLRLRVGPDARYVLDVGRAVEKTVTPGRRLPKSPAKPHPSRIVLVGHSDLPIHKDEDHYNLDGKSVGPMKPFTFKVEVYNFGAKGSGSGKISISVPQSWKVDRPESTVRVGPMGRQELSFLITPTDVDALSPGGVVVRGEFGGKAISPCVSYFKLEKDNRKD
jgi:hypothetical protein